MLKLIGALTIAWFGVKYGVVQAILAGTGTLLLATAHVLG